MIPLTRNRTQIDDNFFGENKTKFEKELLIDQLRIIQGEIEEHDFKSTRWKAAKKQLVEETGGKCAYCEAPTTLVAYGDVEHYRPKSVYWWLAYSYENYLVSCQLCNQKFKNAKFPIKNARMLGPEVGPDADDDFFELNAGKIAPDPLIQEQIDTFVEAHRQERPLILNPYFDDPTEFFGWRADAVLREVELVPLADNPDMEAFCDAAIECYGINRKFLRDARWDRYGFYFLLKEILSEPNTDAVLRAKIQNRIEEMKANDAPFAGMIRYFDSLS